jgi:GH18 family chitinase
MKKLVVLLFLIATLLPAQWITGNYSDQMGMPISAIPWSKYTHVLMFAAAPCTAGDGSVCLFYLLQSDINAIVSAGHAAGKKVLVTIKDNEGNTNAWAQSTAPGTLNTFVSNIANFVNSNGFDGLDLDWEAGGNTTQFNNLIAALRTALPGKLITMSSGDWNGLPQVASASHQYLDQINLMCYAMDYNSYIWHHAAVTQAGDASKPACDARVASHTNLGVPPSKIGVGLPFYARAWNGGTQPGMAGSSTGSEYTYSNMVGNSTWWQPGNKKYDSTYKADYLAVTATNQFVSYAGPQAIHDAVAWAKSKGYGGFMTFALEKEYLPAQSGDAQHPLSTALYSEVFSSSSAPSITSTSLASGTAGTAYSQTLTASGTTPITWSVIGGALPGGLSLNSSSGVISGTPSAPGTFVFTVQAANGAGSSSKQFTVTIGAAVTPPTITTTSPLPVGNVGTPYSQTLAASGTTPLTWTVASGSLPGGLSLNSSSGLISGTPNASGTFTFTAQAANSGGSNSKQFALTMNVVVTAQPPSITTTSPLASGTVGTAYSQTLAASGTAPITWTVTSGALPNGLSLNSSTGVISGTPASPGTFTLAVQAANTAGTAAQQFSLTVASPVTPPSITTASPLPSGTAGTPYSQTLTANGSTPMTWSVTGGALPGGCSLNSSTGVIGGTPNAPGTFAFTVQASNSAGATSQQLSLTVAAAQAPPPASSGQWIVGNYSDQMGVPVSSIPWSKYTHMFMYAAAPCTAGDGTVCLQYLLQSDISAVVAAGHSAGKKVLVTLKDNENNLNAFTQDTASGLLNTFVGNLASFVNSNGFDGVDLGWVSNVNVTQYNSLISALHSALPGKVISMSSGDWNGLQQVAAASANNLDQVNVMCYAMDYLSTIWHQAALTQAGDASKPACDARVAAHTNLGVAPGKIGIVIPFFGKLWNGGTQPGMAGTNAGTEYNYSAIVANSTWWQSGNQKYDSTYKANYLAVGSANQFVSYSGPQAIQDLVAWAKSRGFGGYSAFALDKEYLSGQTGDAQFPLSTALYNAVNSSGATATAPTITSTSPMPVGTSGTAYSQTLTASGTAPISWTVTSGSLPGGLALNSSTGVISGTPNASGTFTFTTQAANSAGSNSKQFTLAINMVVTAQAPSITTASPLASGTVGTAYSQTITASGTAPITWTVTSGSLPGGLALNSSTGVISGTPSQSGAFTFTIQAANSAGTAATQFTLSVASAPAAPPAPTQPPSVTIVTPTAGAWVSGVVPVTVQTASSVVSVQYLLDGVTLATVTQAPFNYNWNASLQRKNSWHSLTAVARDASGSTAKAQTVTVRVR